MAVAEAVRLDVFSDIACPWCYVGHRRLYKALAEEPEGSVEVRYRAFLLNPGLPLEGKPVSEHYREKFGSEEHVRRLHGHVAEQAALDGIEMNWHAVPRVPNTLPLHMLIAVTAGPRQHEVAEALFRAYFTDGVDMGDLQAVVDYVAAAVDGLDAADLGAALESGAGAEAVEQDREWAAAAGITAVPAFVADEAVAITGAQDPALLRKLLAAARRRRADAAA